MRTFISINIDEHVKNIISDIQDNLRDKISGINENFLKAIKWENKDKFHLTIFFIGDVNESKLKKIDFQLSKLESELSLNEVKFELININAFPKLKYPRVLMIELLNKDKKIIELSQRIDSSLIEIGLENDKTFHPHITLGRIKRDHKINLNGLDYEIKSGLNFSVKEFYLMESKLKSSGSEYSVIKNYKL